MRDLFNQASHGKCPPGCPAELSSVAPRRGTCPLRFTSTCLIHLNHAPHSPTPTLLPVRLVVLPLNGEDKLKFLFGHLKALLSACIEMGVYLKQLG